VTAVTGGRLLVDQLAKLGVRRVFGVPGESYLEVLDALRDGPVRYVVCRQEGGAAYMAEAHAKLTGRAGVCLVTRGPGATNALVGLHTARQDATPVVLLVGLIPRGFRGREAFQEIDLAATFGGTAKLVETVDDADRIPEQLVRAFAAAEAGRPGPVVLGLPEDMLTDQTEATSLPPVPAPRAAVGSDALAELDRLLAAAERPVVVLGGGPWTQDATERLRAWAERRALPVAAAWRSHDRIDHDSPSYVGALGLGRAPALAEYLTKADLVITVGAPLGDLTTDGYRLLETTGPAAPALVEVLDYPEPPGRTFVPTLRILAAPVTFAAEVADRPGAPGPWAADTERLRAAHLHWRSPAPDDDELDLVTVLDQLRAELPRDAIVTWGAGNHTRWPQRQLPLHGYPSLLAPRSGSMGYGVPAAVAAALEFPERRVVCVSGDGCFLMSGQEVSTATAYGAAPVILVVNNGSYGTIRAHQERRHPGRVSGTEFPRADFACYARAFGGYGEVVKRTEEFRPALHRAFDAGTVAVLDLRVPTERLGPGVTVADLREAT
jgi:acetolactate synthase-1/2/3 large subunit